MTDRPVRKRKPKARNFYIVVSGSPEKMADFEIENLAALRGGAGALFPPEGRRGFPDYPERPRMVIGEIGNKKLASPPSDIEPFHSYWLISDRLKLLFESIDPEAFAFQACDVKLRDGSSGPAYWLCDVVRVLEAFEQSTANELRGYLEANRLKYLGLLGQALVFDEAAIDDAHIFRTPYSFNDVFCDQSLKDACKGAGIKGIRFRASVRK